MEDIKNNYQNEDFEPQIKVTEEFKGTRTLEDIIKELIVKNLNLGCLRGLE